MFGGKQVVGCWRVHRKSEGIAVLGLGALFKGFENSEQWVTVFGGIVTERGACRKRRWSSGGAKKEKRNSH